jgi:hypothetical protein
MRRAERRLPNETQQTLLRPQQESSRILDLLVEMSLRLVRPMSEEWMQQFLKDTNSFPLPAVEHMISEWGASGKALPKLAETNMLLNIYMAQHAHIELCGNCDSGWKEAGLDKKGNRAVSRCECVSR